MQWTIVYYDSIDKYYEVLSTWISTRTQTLPINRNNPPPKKNRDKIPEKLTKNT